MLSTTDKINFPYPAVTVLISIILMNTNLSLHSQTCEECMIKITPYLKSLMVNYGVRVKGLEKIRLDMRIEYEYQYDIQSSTQMNGKAYSQGRIQDLGARGGGGGGGGSKVI